MQDDPCYFWLIQLLFYFFERFERLGVWLWVNVFEFRGGKLFGVSFESFEKLASQLSDR